MSSKSEEIDPFEEFIVFNKDLLVEWFGTPVPFWPEITKACFDSSCDVSGLQPLSQEDSTILSLLKMTSNLDDIDEALKSEDGHMIAEYMGKHFDIREMISNYGETSIKDVGGHFVMRHVKSNICISHKSLTKMGDIIENRHPVIVKEILEKISSHKISDIKEKFSKMFS